MVALYTDGESKVKLVFRRVSGSLVGFFDPSNLIDGNYPAIHGTAKSSFVKFGIVG